MTLLVRPSNELLGTVLLAGGKGDLVEGMLRDRVRECGGDGQGSGLWLVSSGGVSYVFEFEEVSVGVGELDGSLRLHSAIGARAVAGLRDGGSVSGLEVEAVLARGAGVETVIAQDSDLLR